MFDGCSKLTSLDLSNFNTSCTKNTGDMLYGCSNLLSLDLSHFDLSSVTNLGHMFYGCSKLTSLKLKNFKTLSAEYMDYMFYGCSNLISLGLSDFNTSSVKNMNYMFYGCSNLISLDLNNFDISAVENMDNMFSNCNNYLIYCIKNNSKTNRLINHIYDSPYMFKDNNNCSDICFNPYKKLLLDTKKCAYNCSVNFTFEYNNICYPSCPNGTHNISYNICIENIIIKENKDFLIKDNNIVYQLTSSYNQNYN